jgi:2,5-furandicarboxylate decarboxylase 1
MVFDDDVDIWDDQAVLAAMAFRYMPARDTVILNDCNTMTVDPKCAEPGVASKIGMDCAKPLGGNWNPDELIKSAVTDLGDPPGKVAPMSEAEIAKDMLAFISAEPRAWLDVLKRYYGQSYPLIYGAFGSLRHKLGRMNDAPWYRYTVSDSPFAFESKPAALSNFDPRHVGSTPA